MFKNSNNIIPSLVCGKWLQDSTLHHSDGGCFRIIKCYGVCNSGICVKFSIKLFFRADLLSDSEQKLYLFFLGAGDIEQFPILAVN